MKPDLKFLFAHPAHFIACGFGSGLSPVAPGTAGTLAAFDIVKPQPARWIDGHMKHGFGVMLDDVVAAGYTLLVLALFKVLFGG